MGSLDGQVALITGCGRLKGLGRGIALALAGAGADTVVTDVMASGKRNASEATDPDGAVGWKGLDSVVDEISSLGVRALARVGDVGNKDDAERIVADTIANFGKIDILVNNAAAPHGPDRDWTWKVSEEAWNEVFRVNTKGTFLMSTAVVRHLLERQAPGRIINIASTAGRHGLPQRAAYSASKFAIIGLTQAMAGELAANGITVNAICAGAMDTARGSARQARAAEDAEFVLPSTPPVGRMGAPEDIGRAVLFLAEPAASFITGESLLVTGGGGMY